MTTRTSFLVPSKDPQAGVPLAAPTAEPRREPRYRQRLDVAEGRNPGERRDDQRTKPDERRGAEARAAAAERTADDLCSSRDAEWAADRAADRLVPFPEREPDQDPRRGSAQHRRAEDEPRAGDDPRHEHAHPDTQARTHPDPVPVPHSSASVVGSVPLPFGRPVCREYARFQSPALRGGTDVTDDARPLLVFFFSERSGPARRMDSLLAHLERKERDRMRLRRVDVDQRPDLAERFRVSEVPTLALVKDRRVVARLDGRVSSPRIAAMLDQHLPALEPAAASA